MPKRRITRRQAHRIANIQDKRREKAQQRAAAELEKLGPSDLGPEQEGLLVAHYGAMADIENPHGDITRCLLRQNLGVLVPGDRVIWQQAVHEGGVVVALLERQSVLGRPDQRGNIRPAAANIDQMFIVVAPEPTLITSLLDSYLVAAETLHIKPIIVLNKTDLLTNSSELKQQMGIYEDLGYTVLQASTYDKQGLTEIRQALAGKVSVFVGQSGVGKSSIIASFLPNEEIRVSALAESGRGAHTTTTSRLYHLDTGGDLIDSPGIREFGLWHMPGEDIAKGFIEFQPYLGQCKFRDCQHDREPGCALKEAVAKESISMMRFSNFLKLRTHT